MRLRLSFWLLFTLACALTLVNAYGCADPLASMRVSVVATKEMLAVQCPRGLYTLYPERVEDCRRRLLAQQTAESTYNAAVAAWAIGDGQYKTLIDEVKALVKETLPK